MVADSLILSKLYLETFIEFYDLAKRTQQAGIEFEPLVEIAGFNTLSGRRGTQSVAWLSSHFKGMIPNEDAFIWWNVFFRLSLFTPGDGYASLKMRLHPKGYGTEIINVRDFRALKSEMNYIIDEEWWGPQLMGLCQEWRQFLARDWYPPGLNLDMVNILNNIFVFGGGKIPVYISFDDWDYFVKRELSFSQNYGQEPWKTGFSPWQWDWAWCDVGTTRQYVFMREKIGPDSQGVREARFSFSDMFARVTKIDALEVLKTLQQARNPTLVRSLNYPKGL